MKILVDADATPAKALIEQVARRHAVPLVFVANHNHTLHSEYARLVVVDADNDAADYRLVSIVASGDIVITQDYGLAALMLAKEANVIHPNGWTYTNANIEEKLAQRHQAAKERRRTGRFSHIRPRKNKDDQKLIEVLTALIQDKRGKPRHD